MPSGREPRRVSMKTAKDLSMPTDMVESMVYSVIAVPPGLELIADGRAAEASGHGRRRLRRCGRRAGAADTD
jgi:hypothetical protein